MYSPTHTHVPTTVKLHGLDHLRAFAIFSVFLFHYFIISGGQPGWLPELARFGWTGVDLFFVLSGFLISLQLFRQINEARRISIPDFFVRRFFRIIPAFLTVVVIYFLFPSFREKEQLPPLWKFLTFTQNLGLDLKDHGTFSHAWSLCVEEHFYLLLPISLLLLQRSRWMLRYSYWLFILLILSGLLLRHYSFNELYLPHEANSNAWVYWYRYLYYPTYNRLDGLLIGVGIAAVHVFKPTMWARVSTYGNLLLLAGLILLVAASFLCEDTRSYNASVFGFPTIALAYGLLVAGAISPSSILFRLQSGITNFIATLSYALYLTHKGIIHLTQELLTGFPISSDLMLLICIVTCLLAAFVLHLVIERPFMQLRDRIILRRMKH